MHGGIGHNGGGIGCGCDRVAVRVGGKMTVCHHYCQLLLLRLVLFISFVGCTRIGVMTCLLLDLDCWIGAWVVPVRRSAAAWKRWIKE